MFEGIAQIVNDAFAKAAGADSRERVGNLWSKDSEARRGLERQWQQNVAFYLGQQWVGWDAGRLSVDELKAPAWRIQAVDNKIFVRVRSKVTRLMADSTPQALPETGEDFDIRRAKYKERVLAHIRRETDDRMKKYLAALWVSVCGDAYLEAYWDADAGDTFADDSGLIALGEVGLRVRSPFEVWPGAGCSQNNNGGRLWVADIMPVELARVKYNTEDIGPDANEADDIRLRVKMDNYFAGSSNISPDAKRLEEQCMVKTLYEFRTKLNPQGRISTIIGGKVIEEKPMDWMGVVHLVNMPNFSSYYGDTEVRQALQRQKSYNRLLSSAEEYLRTMKGKWLVAASTKIKTHQIDSEHGEKLVYDGSGPAPTPITPPPLPSDIWNLMQMVTASIDDIFSDHSASQGKAPASASGSAINYLIEEDNRQHTPSRDQWNAGWEKAYEKCLDVAAKYYDNERTILVLGEDRRADVEKVNKDLLGGRNRIKIVIGTSLPENKTLRSEIVRRNFTDGLYGDPTQKETQRKVLKLIDAGIVDDIYDDTFLDEMRAEKENAALAQGIPVAPKPEEDHATHLRVLEHHMKTETFLLYPPEIQALFDDHRELHIMILQPPMMPPVPGSEPIPGNSPAPSNPEDLLKSAAQGGEPPPQAGL